MATKKSYKYKTPFPRQHFVSGKTKESTSKVRTDYDQRLWPVPPNTSHVHKHGTG